MKARKKPVVVECIKWTGDNLQEIRDFVGKDLIINFDLSSKCMKKDMMIRTLEGNHRVIVGDYIIKGVHGEFYPCKPYIFEKTYEVVEDE